MKTAFNFWSKMKSKLFFLLLLHIIASPIRVWSNNNDYEDANTINETMSVRQVYDNIEPSRSIEGRGIKSVAQLTAFFLQKNPHYNKMEIHRLAEFYVREAAIEGINSDVAFVQMCLETGFLTFRGLVKPEMHNYCGLGAIDTSRPGEWFPDELTGVRAHIQHLHAYGTTRLLRQQVVDPRYHYVSRGKASEIYQLAGTWAADREYGNKLERLLSGLARY
jgi:hypothetical protein